MRFMCRKSEHRLLVGMRRIPLDSGGAVRLTLIYSAENKRHALFQRRQTRENARVLLSINGKVGVAAKTKKRKSRATWALVES